VVSGFLNIYPDWNAPARLREVFSDYAANQESTACAKRMSGA